MSTTTYSVPGMSCGHCKQSIEGSVGGVDGVDKVEVNLDSKTVLVEGNADDVAVRAAIDSAGYDIVDA